MKLSCVSRAGVSPSSMMNVLVILNTCQHPMDPNRRYAPKPVHEQSAG